MTADTRNTNHENTPIELSVEQIAYSIQVTRLALDHGSDELPYEISERLRAIRVRALAQQAKQSVQQSEQKKTGAIAEMFNWRHKLTGWFKTGVAVSAFALALMISVVSIRSELTTDLAVSDRAISMTEPSSASIANKQINEQTTLSSNTPENMHALVSSSNMVALRSTAAPQHHGRKTNITIDANKGNTINNDRSAATITTATTPVTELAYQAPAPALTSANPAKSFVSIDDDEIGLVLHEQIPLQAYLNDDFARFANHQGISTIEQLSNANSSTTPE